MGQSQLASLLVIVVLQALAAAAVGSPSGAYLAKNNGKFRQMLSTVSVDDNVLSSMRGVLLAPSDAAVEAFARSMGMTQEQLLANPLLVDQVTAYHFLPNLSVQKGLKLPSTPIMTKTAEVHYIVRYFKDPNTNKAWLLDMQGTRVPLAQQPVVFGNLTVVPLDKVLMSGGYFRSVEDALKLHAQFSKAQELFKRASGIGSTAAAGDVTVFVPVDRAFDASKVSVASLSQQDSRRVLEYHTMSQARPVSKLVSGPQPTLLSGQSVKVDATYSGELKEPWAPGKTIKKPAVSVTDGQGNKADVTLMNIWAGKGVIHGVNKVLQPTGAAMTADKTPAQTTSSTGGSSRPGGRRLLQLLLQAAASHARGAHSSRKLLQSRVGPDWSQSNPASALLASNTVAATYAANQRAAAAYYALPDSPGWAPVNNWSDWLSNA